MFVCNAWNVKILLYDQNAVRFVFIVIRLSLNLPYSEENFLLTSYLNRHKSYMVVTIWKLSVFASDIKRFNIRKSNNVLMPAALSKA
jgi:hypothetical protein